jgi:hypothetical protein
LELLIAEVQRLLHEALLRSPGPEHPLETLEPELTRLRADAAHQVARTKQTLEPLLAHVCAKLPGLLAKLRPCKAVLSTKLCALHALAVTELARLLAKALSLKTRLLVELLRLKVLPRAQVLNTKQRRKVLLTRRKTGLLVCEIGLLRHLRVLEIRRLTKLTLL